MKSTQPCCLLVVFAVCLCFGCADSREQYSSPPSPELNGEEEPVVGTNEILLSLEDTVLKQSPASPAKLMSYAEGKSSLLDLFQMSLSLDSHGQAQDERVRANSLKPAVYGVGAAGIDFRTTFAQATAKLELDFGPSPDGEAWYKEGLKIDWNQNPIRQPLQISLLRDYLGEIPAPEAYAPLNISKEMGAFFTEDDPLGQEMLIRFFNYYEGKPADFNCIESRQCYALSYEENIVHYHPGMTLIFGRDERGSLLEVKIQPVVEAGRLVSPFDIAHGQFLLSPADALAAGASTISLGTPWSVFLRQSGMGHPTSYLNYYDGFEARFPGVSVLASRTRFERYYQHPDATIETYFFVSVYTGFPGALLVGRKPLWVTVDLESLEVELTSAHSPLLASGKVYDPNKTLAEHSGLVKFPLAIQMPALAGRPNLQAKLIVALVDYLVGVLKESLPEKATASIHSGVFGEHNSRANREVFGQIYHPAVSASATKIIRIGIEEANAALHVSHKLSQLPFREIIMGAFGDIVNLQAKEGERGLLGISLNSLVQLEDIDRGRNEATLSLLAKNGVTVRKQGRVLYSEGVRIPLFTVNSGALVKNYAEVGMAELVDADVKLYLQPLQDSEDNELYRIVAIEGVPYAKISGLCGLQQLAVKVGDHDLVVQKRIRESLASDEDGCLFKEITNHLGDGSLRAISFPDQGVIFYFKHRELERIRIHLNEHSGIKTIGGEI